MTSDVSSLPTQPPQAVPSAGPRRFAATPLLIGAILTGIAPFLPWVQQTAAAVGNTPASTSSRSASQDLVRIIHQTMLAPDSPATFGLAIDSTVAAFALWGVPLLLIALSLSILWTRRWVPSPTTQALFRLLVLFGVASTLLLVWLYLNIHSDRGVSTNTYLPSVGPAVALLGDLSALVGFIVLARLSSTTRLPTRLETPQPPGARSMSSKANEREESNKPRPVPALPTQPAPPIPPVPAGADEPRRLIPVEEW